MPKTKPKSRKEREIEAREERILDVARDILVEEGYLHLNMDRVATAIEYSKGTVYQHFRSKEDLVGALVVRALSRRLALFQRAATFVGRPRERIIAIGLADELVNQLDPGYARLEQVIAVSSITEKIHPDRRREIQALYAECRGILTGPVHQAIEQGDLEVTSSDEPLRIAFGLWSLSVGAHRIRQSPLDREPVAELDLREALWISYFKLLDGYGWRPLSHEHDPHATIERARRELFADEWAAAMEDPR